MRIRILCVGKLKEGPERTLVDDYLSRARKLGAGLGFRLIEEIELPAGGGSEAESQRILARTEGTLVSLDEHGRQLSSQDFASRLAVWRDRGEAIDFAIGGADGHGAPLRSAARECIALGIQTWPHRLVRVMLAEQVYRALSIAAGAPYHRD